MLKLLDFACRSCAHVFEELVRNGDAGDALRCPACGAVGADPKTTSFAVGGRASLTRSAQSASSGCTPRGGFS